jgi:FAD/FMN-containing dehydrogenase
VKPDSPFVLHAGFLARGLGPVGWIGVAGLLVAAAALLVVVPALARANARQAIEVEALQQRWDQRHDPASASATRDPAATLAAALPPASDVADFVAAVQRRADDAAVQVDRTEYRVQPVLGHAAARYRLRFPAHADYPHLRTWLEALLHDYPSLTLDEISLRRAVDGGEELEANIALSFLVRERP